MPISSLSFQVIHAKKRSQWITLFEIASQWSTSQAYWMTLALISNIANYLKYNYFWDCDGIDNVTLRLWKFSDICSRHIVGVAGDDIMFHILVKYEMDPTSTVGAAERTRDAGRMDRRTDRVRPNITHILCGWIIMRGKWHKQWKTVLMSLTSCAHTQNYLGIIVLYYALHQRQVAIPCHSVFRHRVVLSLETTEIYLALHPKTWTWTSVIIYEQQYD